MQLRAENIIKSYKGREVVKGISIEVNQGEIVGLLGPNGAGKTTLLGSIAGVHRATSGSILLNGQDITGIPSHKRVQAGLALVPEGRKLFTEMTIEENLRLGSTSARPGYWTVDNVLEVFPNLIKRRHSKTGLLSGGEQQATAIGRALMSNPEILILDEVSLGLSPLVVNQVYDSLKRLLETDTTIILVEQDLTRAMKVDSRAVCMLEGEIILNKQMSEVSREEITDAYFGLHKVKDR
jgi:branched-chain amino acid transport system ATP-binding protein